MEKSNIPDFNFNVKTDILRFYANHWNPETQTVLDLFNIISKAYEQTVKQGIKFHLEGFTPLRRYKENNVVNVDHVEEITAEEIARELAGVCSDDLLIACDAFGMCLLAYDPDSFNETKDGIVIVSKEKIKGIIDNFAYYDHTTTKDD